MSNNRVTPIQNSKKWNLGFLLFGIIGLNHQNPKMYNILRPLGFFSVSVGQSVPPSLPVPLPPIPPSSLPLLPLDGLHPVSVLFSFFFLSPGTLPDLVSPSVTHIAPCFCKPNTAQHYHAPLILSPPSPPLSPFLLPTRVSIPSSRPPAPNQVDCIKCVNLAEFSIVLNATKCAVTAQGFFSSL